jgi:hypothetical protein
VVGIETDWLVTAASGAADMGALVVDIGWNVGAATAAWVIMGMATDAGAIVGIASAWTGIAETDIGWAVVAEDGRKKCDVGVADPVAACGT